MIKTAAGWIIDVALLNVGDVIVIKCEAWPHNFSSLDFKELSQVMYNDNAKGIYAAVVNYKPSQGLQIAQQNKPQVMVFKGEPQNEGKQQ